MNKLDNKQFKLVLNIAYSKGSLLKLYIRNQVEDDAETLKRLIKQAEAGNPEALAGLQYYEQFYQNMNTSNTWDKRADALNNVSFSKNLNCPEFQEQAVADFKPFAIEHADEMKRKKAFAGKVSALKRKIKNAKAGK